MTKLWPPARVDAGRAVATAARFEAAELPPPDLAALREIGIEACLDRRILPLTRVGALRPVLAAPDFVTDDTRRFLARRLGPSSLILHPGDRIEAELLALSRDDMIRRAEALVPGEYSCRTIPLTRAAVPLSLVLLSLACLAVLAPGPFVAGGMWLALAVATLNAALGLLALAVSFARPPAPTDNVALARLPVVTVLVPLFRETAIVDQLLTRLMQFDYPVDRLDILLICEEDDHEMRGALAAAATCPPMRIVAVPRGPVQTKPRAMNYALHFARGTIVGIYDAEDMPDRDQLQKVAHRFAQLGPDVACLQGVLAYDNVADSWITRAFALDYAMWFRLILPALSRVGAVVPLGGTTVFFRRAALNAIGGWDAHNVTEDADLGVRLRRMGYRCELIDSVTHEEATCRIWPWIRQRSRWLKGYALTWTVHMRAPRRLWRELGPAGFGWFQLLFLGALGGFALAPLLWLCWLRIWPATAALMPVGAPGGLVLALPLGASALVQLALAIRAAARAGLPRLIPWIPVLWPYFALGTLAVYRALTEVVARPYWWDKTSHGVSPSRGAPE